MLSATMILELLLMTISSTFASLWPSLLLNDVAVDKARSEFGMSRKLTPSFFKEDFSSRPVFCTSRGVMRKL